MDDKYNEIWPKGIPRQSKDDFKECESKAKKPETTVEELDEWYCERIKLRDIHNKQLAHMTTQRRKDAKKLLIQLANTELEDQEKAIKFHKVGLNKDYKFEEVVKDIAQETKDAYERQIADLQAQLNTKNLPRIRAKASPTIETQRTGEDTYAHD